MKYVLPTSLFAVFFHALIAQPALEWQKSLGGNGTESAYSILQTTDGGYITAGESSSSDGDVSGNHGGLDGWISKLSPAGKLQWQKSYGGFQFDGIRSVRQTSDGGYIAAAWSASNDGDVSGNHGGFDFWVVKLTTIGDIQWQKSLGGSGDEYVYSIQQTKDGGYIAAGFSNSNNGNVSNNHGGFDFWVVKLDSTGNLQWQRSLGGSNDDHACAIQQTSDGGYIVAGESASNNGNVSGNHGGFDFWLVKLNAIGTIQWQKSLGGSADETAWSVEQTNDGGYIAAGKSFSNNGDVSGNHGSRDMWIVKLDASGLLQWQNAVGGSAADEAFSIRQTSDGGFVAAGCSTSDDLAVSGNHGGQDVWIAKMDSSGVLQWQQSLGGSADDLTHDVHQTQDNGFILAGETHSNNGNVSANYGSGDVWVVKTSPDTLLGPGNWSQKSSFKGTPRNGALTFSIGAKGYIGTGSGPNIAVNDFWEYDPTTNTWTQRASLGPEGRFYGAGFSIGSKGYAGWGFSDSGHFLHDFWEYNPTTDTWTKKADFPGLARMTPVAFSIGDKGYVGTGYDSLNNILDDFWAYDPTTDTWTKKADFGGLPTWAAVGFSIGTKGYIGAGSNSISCCIQADDFWEYDPATDTWTKKAKVPGGPRTSAAGFSTGGKGYIGIGVTYQASPTDFWEYDPATDQWTRISDYPGITNVDAVGLAIGDKGYIGTGFSNSHAVNTNEFWAYIPKLQATVIYPKLILSAVQVNPGQSLTINGANFSPDGAVDLSIALPDGTKLTLNIQADSNGAFSYAYIAPNLPGSYSAQARNGQNGFSSVVKAFLVKGPPAPPVDYLSLVAPAAGQTLSLNDAGLTAFVVRFTDKLFLSGSVYPLQNAFRLYRYKIEYSKDNGPWQSLGEKTGSGMVNEVVLIPYVAQASLAAGAYRVRVTDLYDPVRQTTGPVFMIQSAMNHFNIDFAWDDSYLPHPEPTIEGVAADGVGRFYIKVYKASGGPAIQSASIRLTDPTWANNNYSAKLGKLMKADTVRRYTEEANKASGIEAINTTPEVDTFWFWYVAPDDFARFSSDFALKERTINAEVTATFTGGDTTKIVKPIRIVRPPVILAHGLAGTPALWDIFRLSKGMPLIDDTQHFELLPKAITLDGYGYFSDNSMGGSIIRYCLSEKINGKSNYIFNLFFANNSYHKGLTHKIITIDTPHNGSPMADLLNWYIEDPLVFLVANKKLKLANLYDLAPAVINLQIDSLGNRGGVNFDATPANTKIHTIASRIDCQSFAEPSDNTNLWRVLYNSYKIKLDVPSCMERKTMLADLGLDPAFIDASDLIVGTNSQLAGDSQLITKNNKTVFANLTHSEPFPNRVISYPKVADTTLFLLNQNVSSKYFSTLPKTPNVQGGGNASFRPTPAPPPGPNKIAILAPAGGTSLQIDQTLPIQVSILDTLGLQELVILFQGEFYFVNQKEPLINLNIQVNGNQMENQRIMAVAYYNTPGIGIEHYIDEKTVYITTDEPIAAFSAIPKIYFPQPGDTIRPTYTATFNTFMGELGYSPAITASIDDPSKLLYDSINNSFIAIDTGSTFSVVSYKGLNDTLFFYLLPSEDSSSTTSIPDKEIKYHSDGFAWQIFPNPGQDVVDITGTFSEGGQASITLYDLLGRSILPPQKWVHVSGDNQTRLEVGQLPDGLYLCRLQVGTHSYVKPLIVKK